MFSAVERVSDLLAQPENDKPRQTLWRIYSKRSVLSAGAIEGPIVFANNDHPGVMMGGAVRAYANRWAVVRTVRWLCSPTMTTVTELGQT